VMDCVETTLFFFLFFLKKILCYKIVIFQPLKFYE
jgi:hypothetical protein